MQILHHAWEAADRWLTLEVSHVQFRHKSPFSRVEKDWWPPDPTPHPPLPLPTPRAAILSFSSFFLKKKPVAAGFSVPVLHRASLGERQTHAHAPTVCTQRNDDLISKLPKTHTHTHAQAEKKKQKTNVKLAHQRFPYTLRQWLESKWLTVSVERLEAAGRQQEGCRCHWCATRLRRIDQSLGEWIASPDCCLFTWTAAAFCFFFQLFKLFLPSV